MGIRGRNWPGTSRIGAVVVAAAMATLPPVHVGMDAGNDPAIASVPATRPLDPADVAILRAAMVAALVAPEAGGDAMAAPTPAALQPPATTTPAEAVASAVARSVVVPLPVRRPSGLSVAAAPDTPPPPVRTRRSRMAATVTALPPAPAAEPSFFDKLFGVGQSPVTAYAALESGPVEKTFRKGLSQVPTASAPAAPLNLASPRTAVYDISARTVTLPSGERLEAHSGYGAVMDDPRHVHVPMRGATPPGSYDLTEREAPFHGVRAIRLTPSNGAAAPYGRVGLLAHTYMLRSQPGASNGCVVFRDYDRFLQAYLRGEVQKLIVVASRD